VKAVATRGKRTRAAGEGRDSSAGSVRANWQKRDLAVVRLKGPQSLFTALRLTDVIIRAIRERRHLAVDLTGAVVVDSAPIGVLLAGRRHLLEHGKGLALVIAASDEPLRKLLRAADALHLFPISESPDEAIEAARSAAGAVADEELPWQKLARRGRGGARRDSRAT
jgi:anti-anti-sigma regulatory factor